MLVVALEAALVVVGVVLMTVGDAGGYRLTRMRELSLHESGSIVRGHQGDLLQLRLDGEYGEGIWVFARRGSAAMLRPVHVARMPVACADARDPMPRMSEAGKIAQAGSSCVLKGTTRFIVEGLSIALLSPGVTTIKGWHLAPGAKAPAEAPSSPPDFVYVILVER